MAADPLDKLSNWTKFRPRLCQGCWAGCCRLPVEATAADLLRLGLLLEDDLGSGLKKVARRLIASGKVHQYRASTGVFTLAQTAAGDCIFLGRDRLCTVYATRPAVCRRFPEIGPRPGYCPARRAAPVG